MRSNMNLLHKSDKNDRLIDHLRQELSVILDSGILTYPHTLEQIGIQSELTYKERRNVFGLPTFEANHSINELKFIKNMEYKAQKIRQSNWAWRIGEEAQEKLANGWHPFFVTLTVDPMKADPKQLWTEGREFRKYIRQLVNVVCKEMGHAPAHKKPYRPESNYVTYAGVIEHGKSREHHHGHFVIWMRGIPASWRTCPNAGIRNPANRIRNECLPMRTYWKWSLPGLSPALYFRSIGDVWQSKYNFALPLKDGQPMRIATARVAGAYITKYLSKEHKEWHHRMKATRNLGMNTLRETMRKLPQAVVHALTWRANTSQQNTTLIMTSSVPLGLMRSEAKRQNYLNLYEANQLDMNTLMQSNLGMFGKMLTSVRDGARPDRMDSPAFFDWVGRLLPAQKGYSETLQLASHEAIADTYPPLTVIKTHIKQGANYIGHS
jgi:hypothetical protein